MYCLSDRQIDFILDDIRRNGIEKEDLQLNLLDHICCIIEQELEENGDFEQFYFALIRRFYKRDLSEIEEETNSLLMFKNYYFMKKLMLLSGAFAACSLTLGIVLKFIHSAGANFLIVAGILVFSLIFLPLVVTLKIKEKTNTRDKLLLFIGSLSAISISLAILFKLQHWSGANQLGIVAVGVLAIIFLPVYFISGIKQPESKVNTIVSSVLLVTGCGLFLSLARTPQSSYHIKKSLTENYLRNEMLVKNQSGKTTMDTSVLDVTATRINNYCNILKAGIIQHELKNDQIAEGDVMILDEDQTNVFYVNNEAKATLQELKAQVLMYNKLISVSYPYKQIIPTDIPVLNEDNGYRVLPTLNELIQIQMFVQQNR